MDIEGMEPTIKVIAMPQDTNPDGDLFGGWIVSMMDLAGAVVAKRTARNRIVTVAMENIKFMKPVFVGDFLECFARVIKVGRSSITVEVDARVERRLTGDVEQVTEGCFIYVAIDDNRKPVPVHLDMREKPARPKN
jgi:acyl-CoA thioesterase YciA